MKLNERVLPILSVVSVLLFILGLMSFFGGSQEADSTITSSASEGARIQAIQEMIDRGQTSYQYETGQMPPPMTSQ